jgi:hypothetical protein
MRNVDMIMVIVHDRDTNAPLRVDPELIAHILRKTPRINSSPTPGRRTLVFAMSREEWEDELPAETRPAL